MCEKREENIYKINVYEPVRVQQCVLAAFHISCPCQHASAAA